MKKPSSNTSFHSKALSQLNQMKSEYKKGTEGHRAMIFESMSKGMKWVIPLRKSEKKRNNFRDLIGDVKKSHLTACVMRYIMSAKSAKAKKVADKRARAMNYLYDVLKIDPSDFASEIPKHGGVEKLARAAAAAKKSPLSTSDAATNKKRSSASSGTFSKPRAKSAPIGKSPFPSGRTPRVVSVNDNWPQVTLRVDPSLNDVLLEADDGARIELIVVKKPNGFDVKKVLKIAKKSAA